MYRTLALVLLGLTLGNVSAFAGEDPGLSAVTPPAGAELLTPSVGSADRSLLRVGMRVRRPSALPLLYVSLAALQAFDGYSTSAGLAHGAQEVNPVMQGIAGNSAALWAVKAGSTAASIWLAERMWKTNRVGAIVTMVAVNGVMASVAARNAAVLRGMR